MRRPATKIETSQTAACGPRSGHMSDNASGLNGSAQLHNPASEQCIEVTCSPKSAQKCLCRKNQKFPSPCPAGAFHATGTNTRQRDGPRCLPESNLASWQLQGAGVKSAGRGFKDCPRIGAMNAASIRESWDYHLAEPSERLASVSNPSDVAADPVPYTRSNLESGHFCGLDLSLPRMISISSTMALCSQVMSATP